MKTGSMGRVYEDGEIITRQGEVGDCMYVIQSGEVAVSVMQGGEDVRIAVRGAGDIIGEMAIFEREVRSATVRALGSARVMTIDKKSFLRRIQEDPTLAFRIMETMSARLREMSDEVARLKGASRELPTVPV